MNSFIKAIQKKLDMTVEWKKKAKILLLIINLNSDKIKEKCRFCLKYLHFLHLLSLEHCHNFMNNVKCPLIRV